MKKIIIFLIIDFIVSVMAYSQSGWNQINSGTSFSLYDIYFFNPNTGLVLASNYSLDSSIILKSTNAGINWFSIYNIQGHFRDFDFINSQTGYLCGPNISKTTNGGYNWINLATASTNLRSLSFPNQDTGYAVGGTVIMKTTNGTNFSVLPNVTGNPLLYRTWFTNGNTGFVVGDAFYIYKTTSGGQNWVLTHMGVTYINDIFFLNQNTGFAVGFASFTMKFGSTFNNGNSWNIITFNPFGEQYDKIFFVNSTTGYLVGYPSRVAKSSNGGSNWFSQSLPIPGLFLESVYFVNANTGFISGDGGNIFKTTNGGEIVGIKSINTEIPKSFSLHQNYPNPFNPSTKIRFEIPLSRGLPAQAGVDVPSPRDGRGVSVKLIVYNVLGNEITTLVNENLSPGTYESEWDASNYASGVYYYRLNAGDFSETKKMVLIK